MSQKSLVPVITQHKAATLTTNSVISGLRSDLVLPSGHKSTALSSGVNTPAET